MDEKCTRDQTAWERNIVACATGCWDTHLVNTDANGTPVGFGCHAYTNVHSLEQVRASIHPYLLEEFDEGKPSASVGAVISIDRDAFDHAELGEVRG